MDVITSRAFFRRLDADAVTVAGAAGGAIVATTLRRGRLRRPLPMRLEVSAWSPRLGSAVELLPCRRVRPSRRYFRAGNELLDDLERRVDGYVSSATSAS
jgi:hypothetical protein